MGVRVYGEWARGCMVSWRGGVWRVGVGVYGEGACGWMEWARGCMESVRGGVWRVGEWVDGKWVRGCMEKG